MSTKIKIGLLSLESCGGCIGRIVTHSSLRDTFEKFEFFNLLSSDKNPDFIFIEGSAQTKAQNKTLESLKGAKNIVLLGACSLNPKALLGLGGAKEPEKVLNVKFKVTGCPPSHEEISRLLSALLVDKVDALTTHPVCKECSEKEIRCLLLDGKECMGVETIGGCSVLCPGVGSSCTGCRTKLKD